MATIPTPVGYPLGPPTLSGTEITLDAYSQQPTRVTRAVADLTLQRFIMDRVFNNAGGVSGGAVVYDLVTENDLFLTRDVQKVAPAAEFPIVTSARLAPKVATPDKWGGKFFVTDEARDRNVQTGFNNQVRKIANTIIRKENQYAVAVLEAAVSANSRTLTGHSWSGAIPPGYYGSTTTAPSSTPFGDLALAQKNANVDELGINYNTLLLAPAEYNSLLNFMQFNAANLRQAMADLGITDVFASNRVTAGTAYLVASGNVGNYHVEKPLSTESWREQETQRTWWQTDVRLLAYVENPFAIIKLTGLA